MDAFPFEGVSSLNLATLCSARGGFFMVVEKDGFLTDAADVGRLFGRLRPYLRADFLLQPRHKFAHHLENFPESFSGLVQPRVEI